MKKNTTYEQAVKRLQEITDQLDSGDTGLEQAMKLFEEGAEVSAFCYKKLKDAEQKIKEFEKTEDSADDSE